MNEKIDTALIFAAGLGTRMRHLTQSTPKPLLRVRGKPLLYHALDILELNHNIKNILVNCHYHSEQIIEALKNYPSKRSDITFTTLYEEVLLDTGGTVAKLAKKVTQPIITMNSDVLFSYHNYTQDLMNAFNQKDMDFLMLLQPCATAYGYDGIGEFDIDPISKRLIHTNGARHPYMFTGIQILHPLVIAQEQQKTNLQTFSLREIFYQATEKNRAYGYINQHSWNHASTPEDLERLNRTT